MNEIDMGPACSNVVIMLTTHDIEWGRMCSNIIIHLIKAHVPMKYGLGPACPNVIKFDQGMRVCEILTGPPRARI